MHPLGPVVQLVTELVQRLVEDEGSKQRLCGVLVSGKQTSAIDDSRVRAG